MIGPMSSKQAANAVLAKAFCRLIRLYQLVLSPWIGQQCRYYPTCSNYALEAIHRFGPWRGSLLGIRRILKCNPWFGGGLDPVPDSEHSASSELRNRNQKILSERVSPCCLPK
jgi:putative membrane protein insertion efficiency factor